MKQVMSPTLLQLIDWVQTRPFKIVPNKPASTEAAKWPIGQGTLGCWLMPHLDGQGPDDLNCMQ
jgi:hypothetical protein